MESEKVRWTAAARLDLIEIDAYISQTSPELGDRVTEAIYNSTKKLAQFPHIGQTVVVNRKQFRRLTVKSHLVFYSVAADRTVDVIAVLHGARRYSSILRKRARDEE